MPVVFAVSALTARGTAVFWNEKILKKIKMAHIASTLLTIILISTIISFPHYLSYYNILAGGTNNGYKIATDSNYDWGQDIKRLGKWVSDNNIEKIYTHLFSANKLDYYLNDKNKWFNLEYDDLPPSGSYLAVSAQELQNNIYDRNLPEIKKTMITLRDFCENNLQDYDWKIIIADNNSADRTAEMAKKLEKESDGKIIYKFIPQKGKGLAIRESWKSFDADFYIFMDADMATNLSALPILIKELENGDDLVIGSRFIKDSSDKRTMARKITSKVFSILTRLMFGLKIKDYPCGFKGANKNVINKILPMVENNAFFFDTELVIRSAAEGMKIKEIPVIWKDRDKTASKSRVNVLKVTKEYLRELLKLKKDLKII